jgi:RHS repeat-associated protein
VQKKVTIGTTIYTTDYQGGYQYYTPPSGAGGLQFFPHAEGYVNVINGERFNYVYNYTDHLGNIRVSYGIDPESNVLKILEENHYYPFGLKHKNYGVDLRTYRDNGLGEIRLPLVSEVSYKYKYNGKEYQDELGLNFYDYGARNYDPALGRWMNIDPLAEKYFDNSNYVYVINNPLLFTDPDGMEIKGVNKESAKSFHEDINDVFADTKFGALRALITRGKKNENKKFDTIDSDKFNEATKDLSGDDKLLAEILVGAINSEKEFIVEYYDGENSTISAEGQELVKNDAEKKYGTRPDGEIKGTHIMALGGEGLSNPSEKGSHNFIHRNGNHLEGKRSLTSFHEVLGHGTAHAKGMTGNANHDNAIRLENLTRKILGIQTMRDGTNPKHAGGHKVPNNSGNPIKL